MRGDSPRSWPSPDRGGPGRGKVAEARAVRPTNISQRNVEGWSILGRKARSPHVAPRLAESACRGVRLVALCPGEDSGTFGSQWNATMETGRKGPVERALRSPGADSGHPSVAASALPFDGVGVPFEELVQEAAFLAPAVQDVHAVADGDRVRGPGCGASDRTCIAVPALGERNAAGDAQAELSPGVPRG